MSIRSVRQKIGVALADGLLRQEEATRIVAEARKGRLTTGEINEVKKLYGTAPAVYLYEMYETPATPIKSPYRTPVMTLEAGGVIFDFLYAVGVSAVELGRLAAEAVSKQLLAK